MLVHPRTEKPAPDWLIRAGIILSFVAPDDPMNIAASGSEINSMGSCNAHPFATSTGILT